MLKKRMKELIEFNCPYDDMIKNNGIYEFYSEGRKSIGASFEDGEAGDYDEERYVYNLFIGDEYINISAAGTADNILPDPVLTEITNRWNEFEIKEYHLELIFLKAVLLLRKINRCSSKEEQLKEVRDWYINGILSKEDLMDWISFLKAPKETEIIEEEDDIFDHNEEMYSPSSTAGDYGPSNPWDAPGMSIRDFI